MKGHSPDEVAFLIRAIVEACKLRKAPLSHIRVCQTLGSKVSAAFDLEPLSEDGITIELTNETTRRIEFFRFPTG